MGASTMLSILRLKEGLRQESWKGAGSRNTRYVREEGGLHPPDPLPLYFSFSMTEQKYCVAFLFKFSISARATDSASYM